MYSKEAKRDIYDDFKLKKELFFSVGRVKKKYIVLYRL